jgi:hypothetical protein
MVLSISRLNLRMQEEATNARIPSLGGEYQERDLSLYNL